LKLNGPAITAHLHQCNFISIQIHPTMNSSSLGGIERRILWRRVWLEKFLSASWRLFFLPSRERLFFLSCPHKRPAAMKSSNNFSERSHKCSTARSFALVIVAGAACFYKSIMLYRAVFANSNLQIDTQWWNDVESTIKQVAYRPKFPTPGDNCFVIMRAWPRGPQI
jgi:hypothetical protein